MRCHSIGRVVYCLNPIGININQAGGNLDIRLIARDIGAHVNPYSYWFSN